MANTLATLSSKLAQQLRDTDHATWNSIEKDDLVRWSVAGLFPKRSRYPDPSLSAQTITLVEGTYFYSLPTGMLEVSTVDLIDTNGDEAGPVDGASWQVTGEWQGGTQKLRLSPQIVDNIGGTVRLHGYSRFEIGTVGAGITLATSAAADDIIDTATAHGFVSGQPIEFASLTGGTGLTAGMVYFVLAASLAAQTFKISTVVGGTAVNFSTDITAGTVFATQYIPDDLVSLVLANARAEAYRRMGADRAAFANWQAANQRQNVSINELYSLITEAESEAMRTDRSVPRVWRRPVPGRAG
jgi:hypothetical protein